MSLSRMEAKQPVARDSVFAVHHVQRDSTLNSVVRAQIGRRLRVLFDGEREPVPDRFLEILSRLDAQTAAAESEG